MGANLTNEIADGAVLNPERQHLLRQLKAGEKVLTKVRGENITISKMPTPSWASS